MTWFIDEYLDKTLRSLDLCPGVDVSITVHGDAPDYADDIDVYVFWSAPNTSTDWYPVGRIDKGCISFFYEKGTENPEHWGDLLCEMADAIEKKLNGQL